MKQYMMNLYIPIKMRIIMNLLRQKLPLGIERVY